MPDYEDDDVVICLKCGHETPDRYFMCDREDGQWCPTCFDGTACGKGEHGEGCPTGVWSS